MAKKEQRVIERLIEFADFCKRMKMCKSRSEFERQCGLAHNYLYNSSINTKSSIGSDQLARIKERFPMMNLTWIITGKGIMVQQAPDEGYQVAYDGLMKKINEIRDDLNKLCYQYATKLEK